MDNNLNLVRKVIIYLVLLGLGFSVTYFIWPSAGIVRKTATVIGLKSPRVIGFLPYWLIDKADKDYSRVVSEITYFSLTVNPDGTIQKYVKPGEAEPGWYGLISGKFKAPENIEKSLAVFNGNPDIIDALISNPASSAAVLAGEINPVMEEYGFTALNIDLESVRDASESARQNFIVFVAGLKKKLNRPLTIDISPTDLIKNRLIDPAAVAPFVDQVILMTYDYHYAGSQVTGPVAPSFGAGIESEFDVETGIQKALAVLPAEKIILGIPLYGYEWETLTPDTRSAVLPGSGVVASNRRVEEFLTGCSSCSAQIEELARESYLVYFDQAINTYHQIFYPDKKFMQNKIEIAKKYQLGGVAFWALGYEGNTILDPVADYLK